MLGLSLSGQSGSGILTGITIDHSGARIGAKLISPLRVLALFAINDDETWLDAPILADHCRVPTPPFFRFAEPDQMG